MLNAIHVRTLLGAMILCVPALAIIPPDVAIRIDGADLLEPYHYVVHEGDLVTLSVTAEPGDLIWAFACRINAGGEVDYSISVPLFSDLAPNGTLSGMFKIPNGLAGQAFSIEARKVSQDGHLGNSSTVRVDVERALRMRGPVLLRREEAPGLE